MVSKQQTGVHQFSWECCIERDDKKKEIHDKIKSKPGINASFVAKQRVTVSRKRLE